jgi:hypothetical protein
MYCKFILQHFYTTSHTYFYMLYYETYHVTNTDNLNDSYSQHLDDIKQCNFAKFNTAAL